MNLGLYPPRINFVAAAGENFSAKPATAEFSIFVSRIQCIISVRPVV